MDVQGEGFFDGSKMPFFGSAGLDEGFTEGGVLAYTGGGSSIGSQGRCVGSGNSGAAEGFSAKNHLFPMVRVVVAVETEVVVAVNVDVEKTVVVTGSGVTKVAPFKTVFSLRI